MTEKFQELIDLETQLIENTIRVYSRYYKTWNRFKLRDKAIKIHMKLIARIMGNRKEITPQVRVDRWNKVVSWCNKKLKKDSQERLNW